MTFIPCVSISLRDLTAATYHSDLVITLHYERYADVLQVKCDRSKLQHVTVLQ
jgi:hypothetical protein